MADDQAAPLPDTAVRLAAIQHVEYRGFTDPQPEDFAIAEDMLAAAAPALYAQGQQAAVCERVAEQQLVHDDLALLLRVLGLGDHARPQSPHEVMLDAINEVGRLRARVESGEQTGAQIRAAQREDDARLVETEAATTAPFAHRRSLSRVADLIRHGGTP